MFGVVWSVVSGGRQLSVYRDGGYNSQVARGKASSIVRARCYFTGIVQGVGFRPTLTRIAREEGLKGWVLNSTTGVTCEVEGEKSACERFFRRMHSDAPPLSKITSSFMEILPPIGFESFEIRQSEEEAGEITLISPDTAICADCARELLDPRDRRFRYPFINCTNCGPRYSIIDALPYDRPNTTMREFEMCQECRQEYVDREDRRYHAQPNACHRCGPNVFLTNEDGNVLAEREEALTTAVQLLASGAIVAVKGIGGFHLSCDAFNNEAVEELRTRKRRARFKPLAIMVKDFALLKEIAEVSEEELALLASPISPIVLVNKRDSELSRKISPMVAPRTALFGVMVPYSPLHLILFNTSIGQDQKETLEALVMTSANISEEPLVYDNDEAVTRLAGIADYFLMHNRRILAPSDDSIVRFMDGKARTFRIGRGYAPYPVALFTKPDDPTPTDCVLGFGAELKATFALSAGRFALISPHLGDMENLPAQQFHLKTLQHFTDVFRQKPRTIVADKHPVYHSARLAQNYADASSSELRKIQHHYAHMLSAIAENHVKGDTICLSFDGTGYGDDGTIWGGEVLVGNAETYERVGTIETLYLPGGEASIQETWRLGISAILSADETLVEKSIRGFDAEKLVEAGWIIEKMLKEKVSAVPSTSLGRLFDAFSAILGICTNASYEAQAAIELEMCAMNGETAVYLPYEIRERDQLLVLDYRRAVVTSVQVMDHAGIVPFTISEDFENDTPEPIYPEIVKGLARGFIEMLVHAFTEITERVSTKSGIGQVVLSGGCFQNKLLMEGLSQSLRSKKLKVISQSSIPANDAGISLGQVIYGVSRVARERESVHPLTHRE